jgi:hypothetical protein
MLSRGKAVALMRVIAKYIVRMFRLHPHKVGTYTGTTCHLSSFAAHQQGFEMSYIMTKLRSHATREDLHFIRVDRQHVGS